MYLVIEEAPGLILDYATVEGYSLETSDRRRDFGGNKHSGLSERPQAGEGTG